MLPPITPVAAAAHAFLAPSSADRWAACPGSAWMESQFPEAEETPAAREGTACHWVMESVLTQGLMPGTDDTAPNGVRITRDMQDAVSRLQADIVGKLGPNCAHLLEVEQPLQIPRVHPALCFGTPDVKAWTEDPATGRRTLHIWDLKYGFGVREAFESKQLICYAAGALTEANDRIAAAAGHAFSEQRVDVALSLLTYKEEDVDVSLSIAQPRAYHPEGSIRTWNTTAVALRPYVQQLAMAADEATELAGKSNTLKPSAAACENCRARHACPALQATGYRGMDIAQRPVRHDLTDDAAGLELLLLTEAADLLKARITGLEEVIAARLQSGARVPHWQYTRGRGATKWTKTPEEIAALGRMLGLQLAKTDVVTPLQAVAAGLPEGMLASYAEKIPGALKLARADKNEARRIFG